MGNEKAFYQGAQWYDDYQNQARQAKSDAWAQEQQGRMRKDWENQDNTRAGLASMIDGMGTGSTGELVNPRAAIGLADAMPEPSAYAQRQGFEAPVGADVQTPGLASMAPRPSPFFNAQTKLHQQRLAMAKAVGGERGATLALDTGDLMRKTKLQENVTRIEDTVLNLRDKERKLLAEKVTADGGNKYEATIDPATGLMTLKLGDSKVQMTRAQEAKFWGAKYRLQEGDPTAIHDLEQIDTGLAAKVAAEFKSLRDTANDGNKAAYQNATLEVREKGLEQRERLAGIRASGGGGGGSGARGATLQSKTTDENGYIIGVFRDGSAKRLTDADGKPIKADSFEKRVDKETQALMKNSRQHRQMTYEEVRADAERILLSGSAPANPGLATQHTATNQTPGAKPNFSNLWK